MGSHHLVPRVSAIKNESIPSACATHFSEYVSLRALFNSRCPYRKTNSKMLILRLLLQLYLKWQSYSKHTKGVINSLLLCTVYSATPFCLQLKWKLCE